MNKTEGEVEALFLQEDNTLTKICNFLTSIVCLRGTSLLVLTSFRPNIL